MAKSKKPARKAAPRRSGKAPGGRGRGPNKPARKAPLPQPKDPRAEAEEKFKAAKRVEGPRCPQCRHLLSETLAYAYDKKPKWTTDPCRICEEAKSMPLTMSPGGTYKLRKRDDYDPPIVDVKPKVAGRCRYLGEMRLIHDVVCALFIDNDTKDLYAQPHE